MVDTPKHDITDKSDSRAAKRKKARNTPPSASPETNPWGLEKWQRYQAPHQSQRKWNKPTIQSGDSGVFVTCDRAREGKSSAEAVDLFSQYIESPQLEEGHNPSNPDNGGEDDDDDDGDIEAQIKKEVEDMKPAKRADNAPFKVMALDVQCVSFINMNKDIDPVSLVHRICVDADANPGRARCRWIRRLTPITETRKLLSGGLEELATVVLKPYFHLDGPPKKYAIRPTIRQNRDWNRDTVIKLVAAAVGPRHTVDLTNYDHVILVDVIRGVVGMSVVGSDYDRLKRYNPAEIYNPTPKPPAKRDVTTTEQATEPLPDQ